VHAPEGFAEFVAARSPALLRTAWLLTGDRGRAEDLVQEALAKTWRKWSSVAERERPEAYVRAVMVNTSVSWWRRRWRGEIPTELLPDPSGYSDPMAHVDVREAVRQALATLSPRQRAVLVLRYFDDLTETETAAAMGCSVGTVKSQASRAMARLRESPQLGDLVTGGKTGGLVGETR
jgi:RNA polymerase sigma-70 factor (sigma-E family)